MGINPALVMALIVRPKLVSQPTPEVPATQTRTGTFARLSVRSVMSRTGPCPSGMPRIVAIPFVFTQTSTPTTLEPLSLWRLKIATSKAAATKTSVHFRHEGNAAEHLDSDGRFIPNESGHQWRPTAHAPAQD